MSWANAMIDWTERTMEPYGLGAILLVLFVVAYMESSFFPIPPDVIILAFVLSWKEYFLLFALVASVGSVLGGLFGHWIGQRGGRPLLHRFSRPGKVARAEAYFEKWGAWAVGIAGFSPIPYKVFTITAGALRMDRHRFLVASAVSRGARFFLEASLLFLFEEQIKGFIEGPYFNGLTLLGIGVLVLVLYVRSRRPGQVAEGETPSAEGEVHPAEGETPSAEGEVHPAEGEAPPSIFEGSNNGVPVETRKRYNDDTSSEEAKRDRNNEAPELAPEPEGKGEKASSGSQGAPEQSLEAR